MAKTYVQTPFIRSLVAAFGGSVEVPEGWGPMLPSPTPSGVIEAADVVVLEGQVYFVRFMAFNPAAAGDNTILSAVGGKKLTVISIDFVVAAAVSIAWYSGASGGGSVPKRQAQAFAANSGMLRDLARPYFVQTNSGEPLVMNLSAAVSVVGALGYAEVAG